MINRLRLMTNLPNPSHSIHEARRLRVPRGVSGEDLKPPRHGSRSIRPKWGGRPRKRDSDLKRPRWPMPDTLRYSDPLDD